MNIDISKIKEIKSDLDLLEDNKDALFIDEDGKTKYAIIPIDAYDNIEELLALFNGTNTFSPQIKIANGDDLDLSYDEYERIKTQIMDAVEKTLKPKPEKLN